MIELFDDLNFKYKTVNNVLGFWDGTTLTTTDTTI